MDLALAVGEVAVAAIVIGGDDAETGLGRDLLDQSLAEGAVHDVIADGGVVEQEGDGEDLDVRGESGESAVSGGAARQGSHQDLLHSGGSVAENTVGIQLDGVGAAGGLFKRALESEHGGVGVMIDRHIADRERGGIRESKLQNVVVRSKGAAGGHAEQDRHHHDDGQDTGDFFHV